MKKPIFILSLVVMAITLFAFTNHSPTEKQVEQALYWYRIDASGNIGSALNSGVPALKTDVFSEAGCPDEAGDDCARGYETPQTLGNPAPGVSGSDRHIMEDEL